MTWTLFVQIALLVLLATPCLGYLIGEWRKGGRR